VRLERKVMVGLSVARLAGQSGTHAIDAQSCPEPVAAEVPQAAQAPSRVAATPPAGTPARVAKAPIRLPAVGVLVHVLKDLAGQEIPLKEVKGAPADWRAASERYFVSWLVDDENAEVGGILCDVEAVVRLGGALLMLPRSEIDAQVSAGAPNDDVKMATSEIFNNLSGPVNDVPGNPHVRAQPIAALAERVPEWLESARMRLVCAHPGGGKLALVGR
jgi:hypothetical protein